MYNVLIVDAVHIFEFYIPIMLANHLHKNQLQPVLNTFVDSHGSG